MEIKCSVWSDYFSFLTIEEAIDKLSAVGFRYAELSINHTNTLLKREGKPEETGLKLKRYIQDKGFAIPQGHLSFKKGLFDQTAIDDLKKEIDLFLGVGIQNAVIHANGGGNLDEQKRFEGRVQALTELSQYIKGTPLRLCLENLGSVPETHTVTGIRKFIDAVGSDQLKICLDTGHLHLVNGLGQVELSQGDFIRQAGKDLCAMHVTNNSGGGDDHLMPFSSRYGVDWKDVMLALNEIGYDGLFNLEILGENKAPMPILEAKLTYIAQMVRYMTSQEFLNT